MANDKGSTETVTISADEHVDRLMAEVNRHVEVLKDKNLIIRSMRHKIQYFEALKKNTDLHMDSLNGEIKDLESRNLFQRIFNL